MHEDAQEKERNAQQEKRDTVYQSCCWWTSYHH